ncbi:MAG: TonB family protein [Candidatus Omnitrophica bacterium]|nr:TonB family protein [Candidatus Omnitrophota bacterium]
MGAPSKPPAQAPSAIRLERGAIHPFSVKGVQRIAVGDPAIADVTVLSPADVLIQAKAPGTTNLLVWDERGQTTVNLEVLERASEAPELVAQQLRNLIGALNLTKVTVRQESTKLFLVGEVDRQDELDRLEQMLSAFEGVTNLVRLSSAAADQILPTDLVRLDVQIIEISSKDLEKLGVKWSESAKLTEPEATDQTFDKAITRFGTSLTRASLSATLNALVTRNRARTLAEPKLVTTSGKEASSFVGVEVPIITATSFGTDTSTVSASIEFRETGVLLKMTPHVKKREEEPTQITTVVTAELSDIDSSVALSVPVGSQTATVPGFKVRKANTEVTTLSGESIVIAGLLRFDDTENVDQVPAFGSLPVLGRLFRSPEMKYERREIVIVVTPQVVGEEAAGLPQVAEEPAQRSEHLEEAMDVAQVAVRPSVSDPVLRYAAMIQERIAKAIEYPELERTTASTQLKLKVHLFRDGTLGRALVSESSGVDAFDAAAIRAAEARSPYPEFPADIPQEDLWLELPIVFKP